MTTLTTRKTVMIRDMDAELWAAVVEQARTEGLYLRTFVERALRRELARSDRKEQE